MEHVKWSREDLRHTALQVVSFYARTLSHLGTSRWIDFAARIIPAIIGDTAPWEVTLKGDAFALIFHPPKPVLIPCIRDGSVIWQEREPRLEFLDDTYLNLAPGYRNLIYRANRAIAAEVLDTYKMRISDDPFSFVFPKETYGEVAVERAVLIGRR